MTTLSHAERELDILGLTKDSEDELNRLMREDILDIIDMFSTQGHSGVSASYAIGILEKLLRFEPITPLTGEDDEWVALGYSDDVYYQNKRSSRIFKGTDGRAYDIEGIIFYEEYIDDDGDLRKSHFTSGDSRVYITFPYTPVTVYQEYIEGKS